MTSAASPSGLFSPQDYDDVRASAVSFESLGAYWYTEGQTSIDLLGDGSPTQVGAAYVTEGFFPTMGVGPVLGRMFARDEVVPGAGPTVVLSNGLWRTRFGADPGVIGNTVDLEGVSFTIIGVMPETFRFPAPDVRLWLPISLITDDDIPHVRGVRWMNVVGRLVDGVTQGVALEEANRLFSSLNEAYPDTNELWGSGNIESLRDSLVGPLRPALLILMGSTALILLIVCANVGSLVLARTTARRARNRREGLNGGELAPPRAATSHRKRGPRGSRRRVGPRRGSLGHAHAPRHERRVHTPGRDRGRGRPLGGVRPDSLSHHGPPLRDDPRASDLPHRTRRCSKGRRFPRLEGKEVGLAVPSSWHKRPWR